MMSFDDLSQDGQLAALVELANSALAHFDIGGSARARLISLSENATFLVEGGDRLYALRIHRDGYHAPGAIASELAWCVALREAGLVETPRPVWNRHGSLISQLAHPQMSRARAIVMFEWEAGIEPRMSDDNSALFETLGAIAAKMHMHAKQWRPPANFGRFTWDVETALGEAAPHWGRWRDGLGMDAAKEALFARTVTAIGTRLKAYGKGPDRFGLAHCDLRLANLLVDGETLKVIDFDDMGFSWFLYDAAASVSFYEHEPQVPALMEAWVRGYCTVSPLSREEIAEIPTFIMLRRLLLVAWIGSHAETDLARSMGVDYTQGTIALCETFLAAQQ